MGADMRFLPTLQMVADELEDGLKGICFLAGRDEPRLESVCFYLPGMKLTSCCACIVKAEDLNRIPVPEFPCSLIVLGEADGAWKTGFHTILQVPEEQDLLELMNLCQKAFARHMAWAGRLKEIVAQEGSVDELCRASYEYFRNPLFVHDAQLQVISCPVWRDGMIEWEKDELTGLMITPLEVLNEFKTDREYLNTLTTTKASIFSAELRGYRDIYVNIRDAGGAYAGRLVICELEHPLRPGQMAAAEYLTEMVRLVMSRRGHLEKTYKRNLYQMLDGMIHGREYSDSEIEQRIAQCRWKIRDPYVCICMDAGERGEGPFSAASVCSHVEARVEGSRACYDGDRICIIIDLDLNGHYTSDIASILRDGLFKAGFSNVFHDLTRLPDYYRQASTALKYCRKRNDTMWYYTFNDIAMDYIADQCCAEFVPEELCSSELLRLREYDRNNKTELYKTLCTYLLKERNTVATSAQLYVGRSTLFYRLRKIREITGLDVADLSGPVQNLYLRLSIFIMEREETDRKEK